MAKCKQAAVAVLDSLASDCC